MDLTKLCKIAINAALAAGSYILEFKAKDIQVHKKLTGSSHASQVVTMVDKACERIIWEYLKPSCHQYEIGWLSEEIEDNGSRFEKAYFWCVDPLDGTLAFIQNRPGFSVSIALVAKDGTPIIGVVYDPSTENLYHAIQGQGVFKNRKHWMILNQNNYLTYVTDRMLEDTPKKKVIQLLINKHIQEESLNGFKEMAGSGSVLNAIHVLENGPACMIKLPKDDKGGGSIWDFAATACIYQELGQPATQFHGERLDLNKPDGTFMNDQGVFYANL